MIPLYLLDHQLYHVFSSTKYNLPGIIYIIRAKYSVKRSRKNWSFRIGKGKTLSPHFSADRYWTLFLPRRGRKHRIPIFA